MRHKSAVPLLKKLVVTLCAGFILFIGACSGDNSSTLAPASSIKHVIVDTDVDSDDAMAILYLMNAAGVKLDALTVTGTGFMLQVDGVPVALKLVDLGGATDTPVSLRRQHLYPSLWRISRRVAGERPEILCGCRPPGYQSAAGSPVVGPAPGEINPELT